MSLVNPIGGYFELELPAAGNILHSDGLFLNSGRSCLEYALRASHITKVYMPKYTCDVMLEPLKRLGVEYVFYAIDDSLHIISPPEVRESELLVYTNYFGTMGSYCHQLAEQYEECLMLDYSQAWYDEPPQNCHVMYSPRKFFGLPDGGVLLSPGSRLLEELPVDVSYERCAHLLKRIDIGAESGYEDFKTDDAMLSSVPLSHMSQLTTRLISSIDMEAVRQRRIANFRHLHDRLAATNILALDDAQFVGPMCYPYRTTDATLRKRLIDQKIFVATYWPNVLEWCKPEEIEYALTESILPLPIDQRYGLQEMERILEVIHG